MGADTPLLIPLISVEFVGRSEDDSRKQELLTGGSALMPVSRFLRST